MSKNDWRILWLIPLIGAVVFIFIVGYEVGKNKYDVTEKADTTIVSSSYHSPKPIKEIGVGKVDIPVILFTENGKTEVKYVPENAETGTLPNDIHPKDTFRIQVPITQKVYKDSNYVAYVSGFHVNLDSINVQSKVITYTKTVTKHNAFYIGLTGGMGYGLISKKPDVFIGVGFTCRLFK